MNSSSTRKTNKPGTVAGHAGVATIVAASLIISGCGSGFFMGQHPTTKYRTADNLVAEEIRSSVRIIAVKPSSLRPTLVVDGDYGETVPTAGEGAAAGVGAGFEATGEMIGEDPRALLLAPIILPVAVVVGAIFGACAAKVQQQLREFRDELTDDLTDENAQTLPSDVLAQNVHEYLKALPDYDAILITAEERVPLEADAILEIRVTELTVTVNGNDAVMKTTAVAELRRSADREILHSNSYSFREKDTLRNWSKDDNALWDLYVEQSQRHFMRQMSSEFFDGIVLRHVLRPTRNGIGVQRGHWNNAVRSKTPELGWELFLLGGDKYDPWTGTIDTDNVTYELEIYDDGRLVYAADKIAELKHQVLEPLPACKTLSWSVQPRYQIDGKSRTGQWMSSLSSFDQIFRSPTSSTRTETPDFWQGYARITTRCK